MQTWFASATSSSAVSRFSSSLPPPHAHATSGRTRSTTSAGRNGNGKSGRRRQRLENLDELRKTSPALLREDEVVVDEHVELALLSRHDLGGVTRSVDLG